MKKLLIGSLVGGILVFAWQSLSWTALDLHGNEYKKAPNQDSIISYLNSQLNEDGQYFVPRLESSASREEHEKYMENMKGKPWAVISFHKAYDMNMVSNIIRGLIVCIIAAFFVCWILMKNTNSTFGTTFVSCVLIGVAGYLFFPYTGFIWFQGPGAMTFLTDALVSWGLCGLWLGWWLNRGK
jgi:hypothetical protein